MKIEQRIAGFSAALSRPGDDPFAARVGELLTCPPRGWRRTGMDRGTYLDTIERIVRPAAGWIDADGGVIDPFLKREYAQTSPRFAAPGAILLHFGRAPDLRDAVFRAMDHCCRALSSGRAANMSPDFWMRELVTAYLALEDVAGPSRRRRWARWLSDVEPERTYRRVSPDGRDIPRLANWALYGAAGEAMREAAGLTPPRSFLWGNAFFEKYCGGQLECFTEQGMYRDPGDPITYDVTTRLQVACGLAFGYDGPLRTPLEDILRRGGLATLLFASPDGDCPYGGRSAAFHFRESILVALCELEARRYREADPRLAGAFKRQARLCARRVHRAFADMTPWRPIANGFDPALRHGHDGYAAYSCYGLLAASFLGLAAVFADDSIAEAPCPAENGGFVFELAPAFHKVFAVCDGTHLEIDTAADLHYDATGLGRFARRGVPLELGPGMPFPVEGEKWGDPIIRTAPDAPLAPSPVATGPAWREGGRWVSLAGLSEGLRSRVRGIRAARDEVRFAVAYEHPDHPSVVEEYVLTRGGLCIRSSVRGGAGRRPGMRFIVPLLVTNGARRSRIFGPSSGVVRVAYRGCALEVRFGARVRASIASETYANRNGVYRSLLLDTHRSTIELRLHLRRPGDRMA